MHTIAYNPYIIITLFQMCFLPPEISFKSTPHDPDPSGIVCEGKVLRLGELGVESIL